MSKVEAKVDLWLERLFLDSLHKVYLKSLTAGSIWDFQVFEMKTIGVLFPVKVRQEIFFEKKTYLT